MPFFLLASMGVWAQPIVEGGAFTNGGSSLFYANASPLWQPDFDLDAGGEDLTWDLSNFTQTTVDNEGYFPLSQLSFIYGLFFNSSTNPDNIASHVTEVATFELGDAPPIDLPVEFSDIFQFFRNDTTGYYEVGLSVTVSGLPLITPYEEVDRIYTFPMAYDQRDTSFVDYLINIPLLATYGQSGFRYNHVDAWGTLVTPDGQNHEVLRVRAERLLTDTIFFPQFEFGQLIERPLQVDYAWISPELDGELLRITTVAGQVISAQLRTDDPTLSAGVHGAPGDSFTLWPNPSAGMCQAALPGGGGTIEIFDLKGSQLHASYHTGDLTQVDASNLPAGFYLVRFTSVMGEVHTSRLVITSLR